MNGKPITNYELPMVTSNTPGIPVSIRIRLEQEVARDLLADPPRGATSRVGRGTCAWDCSVPC